jgi:hypothetical protein
LQKFKAFWRKRVEKSVAFHHPCSSFRL